ncbi:glycosyltransferase [Vibrio cholerae]|uniref:glycosyltransferase n=1 Tax=Vibrio cholerae TaxID=666 RepID=UPI000BA9993A|nr:glycosyltransferase [Vibrio cholerae]MCD1193112.1 glycosyltransferase [Vibrio cholerae]MCD6670089.1 glycosyltransferase [Vibrio cholerae]PAS04609.1 glycosyltransferase [Vibrio cholerae]TQQ68717.1 glycosyltransferase [Vibrio cholerae]BCN19211.1 putative glycosyltransferase [Vibrio cholerae]
MKMKFTLVIPVYKNEESIPSLLEVLSLMSTQLSRQLSVIFVVDGSPDKSYSILEHRMSDLDFPVKLICHARNFGSFAALRTGLDHVETEYCCVMAADLQEPPSLFIDMFQELEKNDCDVIVGTRDARVDPLLSKVFSSIYWHAYRHFVVPDLPIGGIDVFGCNKSFRHHLLCLKESKTSLIALIYWLGFRRKEISYIRNQREFGSSAWTFKKKFEYMLDSVFSFTDIPIKLLLRLGGGGILLSILLGFIVIFSRVFGFISEPGYSATVILIMFFGALNMFGLGLTAEYAWRAYENTKQRPQSVVMKVTDNYEDF